MTLLSMTSVQISEFYLLCGIVLSWATPVQNLSMIWPLIRELIVFFLFFVFLYFWTTKRSFSTVTSLSMTSLIMQNFFIFKLTPWWSNTVQNFAVIGSLTTKTEGGDAPPPNLNMSKNPVWLGPKMMFCTCAVDFPQLPEWISETFIQNHFQQCEETLR